MENKEELTEDEISLRFSLNGIIQHIRHDIDALNYILERIPKQKEDSTTIPLTDAFKFVKWTNENFDFCTNMWESWDGKRICKTDSELYKLFTESKER